MHLNNAQKMAALIFTPAAVLIFVYYGLIENIPGEITPNVQSDQVSGSFEGKYELRLGLVGRKGGGCLVFQDIDNPFECQSDTFCIEQGQKSNMFGYCNEEEEKGSDPSTCWFKVGESYCRKPVDLPGKYSLGPLSAHPLGPLKAVRWRVLTCQNLTEGGCRLDGADVERRYRFGPVYDVQAKPPLYPENPVPTPGSGSP